MTSLLGARRRAEEFAAALDAPPDQAPPAALADLVDLVATLRAHEPPAPRAELTASLRERLVAEAQETLVQDAALTLPRRRTGARERRLAVAASTFVLVGGSAGLAAAAQNALPGDALYPIKRGIESAQTGLTTDRVAKGRDLLDQADSRLTEVQGLLRADSGAVDHTQVPATIHDFARQAQQGSQLMLESYAQDRDRRVVVEVRSFAADGLKTLQDIAGHAPADEQETLTQAALVLQEIDKEAAQACPGCASDLPALQLPPALLAAADVHRALQRTQGAQLDNTHPTLTTGTPVGPRDAGGSGGRSDQGRSEGTGDTGPRPGPNGNDSGPSSTDGSTTTVPTVPSLPTGGTGLPKKAEDLPKKVGDKTKDVVQDPLDPVLDSLLP